VFRFREPGIAPAPMQPERRPVRVSRVIAAFAGFAALHPGRRSTLQTGRAEPRAATARRSVAVPDFHHLTARPKTAWLASAIPEMLSAELADGQQIRTSTGILDGGRKILLGHLYYLSCITSCNK